MLVTMAISDDQILQAAVDVISEHGYAGATTKQIAAQAGINEVTLFRRFGNKKKLMRKMVEREAGRLTGDEIVYSGDLEADLIQIVKRYQRMLKQRGRIMLMMVSEIPKQPELLEVMDVPQRQSRNIVRLIARYQQEGRLIQEPPMLAVGSLVGPIFVAGALGAIEPDLQQNLFDPEQLVKRFLSGREVRE